MYLYLDLLPSRYVKFLPFGRVFVAEKARSFTQLEDPGIYHSISIYTYM